MAAVLVQADDFSGAAEVGQCFTLHGLATRLLLAGADTSRPAGSAAPAGPDNSRVVVVDTHSRAVPPAAAAAAVTAVFDGPDAAGASILFKKIDSLWRGNVGAEIGALTALGCHVVVAGALPQLGRSVVGGIPLAGGVPLARTDLWHAEAGSPPLRLTELLGTAGVPAVREAGLASVRSGELGPLFRSLSATHPQTVIVDGETTADLAAVVEALAETGFSAGKRRIVLAGTGGVAELLARKVAGLSAREAAQGPARNTQDGPVEAPGSGARAVLAVVGSASSAARRQLGALVDAGFNAFPLTPGELLEHPGGRQLEPVRALLSSGAPVVLSVAAGRMDPAAAQRIARGLGNFARAAADLRVRPDLILTGGETAREVLDILGVRFLAPVDAVQHGAVVSRADDGTLVGTKPGSFGDDLALLQLYELIQNQRGQTVRSAGHQPPLRPDRPTDTPGAAMNSVMTATEQDTRPFIAVTMGDGAGVGPEVTVGALLAENAYRDCRPVVIGDTHRLRLGAQALGLEADIVEVHDVAEAVFEPGRINVIDPKLLPEDLPWGQESAEAGNAAYHYIRIACELGMAGQVQGICTAPLNKAALHKAGHIFPGHTELLAHFMGVEEVSMMLSTPKVKVIHVTTHIGLIDAINKIEPGLVERTVRRGHGAMQRAGIGNPKIGVCAINPHAGENGLFGYGEEAEKITPAIEKLQADGIDARGPLPADTAFFLAGRGDYDLIVAMYHDQGHGPVKVLGIEAGVNITVGLPVIRTSVDHGTAFDIAGKGIVEVGSMIEALRQAAEMSPRPAAQK